MEAISFNLVAMDTSSGKKGKIGEDSMGFSKVLNEFTKEEVKSLDSEVQDQDEESLAYLMDNPMLAMIKFIDYTNLDIDGNINNMDEINGEILAGEILNFNDEIKGQVPSNLVEENLDPIGLETQDELSKDVYSTIGDKVNMESQVDTKETDNKDYGKIQGKGLNDKGLNDKDLISLKDNNLKEKPTIRKDSVNMDLESNFNPKADPEKILMDPKVANILGSEEKLPSKKEEIQTKAFSVEDVQNSLRKIDIKHIDSKEIKTPLLSQENIDVFNDSIIELIQIREEGQDSIMNVKLIPRELGSIDISLKMEQGKLVAKIFVDNEEMKQLFASSIKSLTQNLQRQDIAIEEIQIDLSSNSDNGSNNQENKGQESPFRRNNFGFEERASLKERPIESREMIQDGLSILV